MGTTTLTFTRYLATLSRGELVALLAQRPETLFEWPIVSLGDLAGTWELPWSMVGSMARLPEPALQMLETLAALAQGVTIDVLCDRLQLRGSDADHRQHVVAVLRSLQDHGLAWVGPDSDIWISTEIDEMFPRPLGLGPGVDRHLRQLNVQGMKTLLDSVGLSTAGKREELLGRLSNFYVDADQIAAVARSASDSTLRDLAVWAAGESPLSASYDAHNYARVEASFRWSQARGLIFGYQVWEAQMPAPVVMALGGIDFRALFHPTAPDLPSIDVSAQRVAGAAGTAATYFDSLSLSVLDSIAGQDIPLLAKGGVGVRELAKLADRIKARSDEVRLVVELAFAAELLQRREARLATGPAYEVWRAAEPADRIAVLIAAWWNLGHFPCAYRNPEGKASPALHDMSMGGSDADVRHRAVQMLAELAPSDPEMTRSVTDRDGFIARMLWECPLVIGPESAVPQAIWDECHLLGVIADGACTQTGRALLTFDGEAIQRAVTAILPPAATTGSFGSDLTVMVAGAPSAATAQLLDACAERESRGQASLWRFSPGSVRRALDDGWTPEALQEALRDLASTTLPQTLTYLIGDVARRHGHLKVAVAGCCLISSDTALLTEVCAARPLRHLGLRLIAPTVAVATADAATTTTALRTAGYMPMPDDTGGFQVLPVGASSKAEDRIEAQRRGALATTTSDRVASLVSSGDRLPPALVQRKVEEVAQRVFRDWTRPPPDIPPVLFS